MRGMGEAQAQGGVSGYFSSIDMCLLEAIPSTNLPNPAGIPDIYAALLHARNIFLSHHVLALVRGFTRECS